MSIRKEHAPLGQTVDVGRESLRMSIQAAYPVVKIIDGDKQGIRLGPDGPSGESEEKKDKKRRSLHGMRINRTNLLSYSLTWIFLLLLPDLTPLKVLRLDPSPTFTV